MVRRLWRRENRHHDNLLRLRRPRVERVNRAYVDAVVEPAAFRSSCPCSTRRHADAMLDGLDGLRAERRRRHRPGPLRRGAVARGRRCRPRPRRCELALVAAALERGMPVLGDLPRRAGAQRRLRRDARSQHLPTRHRARHRERARSTRTCTRCDVADGQPPGGGAIGAERVGVNTLHHQAVDRVGAGLRAVALAGRRRRRGHRGPAEARCWACSGTPSCSRTCPGTRSCSRGWYERRARPSRRRADGIAGGSPALDRVPSGGGGGKSQAEPAAAAHPSRLRRPQPLQPDHRRRGGAPRDRRRGARRRARANCACTPAAGR